MANGVTSDLIYEVLEKVQADVSDLKQGQADIVQILQSMRFREAAQMQDNVSMESRIARLETKVERIDRRLDLTMREPLPLASPRC